MNLAQLLFSLPTLLIVFVLVGTGVLLAIAGALWVRRTVPSDVHEANNEFQDFIVGSIFVFYAVFIAFVVIAVWEQFREIDRIVETEANKLGDITRNVEGFPKPFARQVQGRVKEYSRIVVEEEWQALAGGKTSAAARDAFDKLWLDYIGYEPRNPREVAIYAEGLTRLSELRELRRLRLIRGQKDIPAILWLVLLLGAIITVSSSYFLRMRNLRAQVALTGMLAGLISLILLVTFALDHPFLGGHRLHPEPFQIQMEEAERFMQN